MKTFFNSNKLQYNREPSNNKFKISISNKLIEGDVKKLIHFVEQNKYPVIEIDLKYIYNIVNWQGFYKGLSKKQKQKYDNFHFGIIVNTNLNYPIIVSANSEGNITNVLDGLHRIKKAYSLKKTTIKAYVVTENDLLTF